jgi:hypothetical protein
MRKVAVVVGRQISAWDNWLATHQIVWFVVLSAYLSLHDISVVSKAGVDTRYG